MRSRRELLRSGLTATAVLLVPGSGCGGLDQSRTADKILGARAKAIRRMVENPDTGRKEPGLFVVEFDGSLRRPQDGSFWQVFIVPEDSKPVFADWGVDKLMVPAGQDLFLLSDNIWGA